MLTVSKSKLGLESREKVVDNRKYLGYHMNKKHWFTIILDGSIAIEKIFEFIDESYNMK